MIEVTGDFHTHTIYSSGFKKRGTHAIGTIEENANVALKKGLKTLVISDHGPAHYLYGVRKKNLSMIKEEIKALNVIYNQKGLNILLGVESNLISLDGRLDVDNDILKIIDVLLMGYHYGATPSSLKDAYGLYIINPASKVIKSLEEKAIELNTKAYIKALDNYPVHMITHPGSKAKIDIREVAKKAGKVGTALEISAKHDQLSVENLKKIKDLDVFYYINSDAHRPEDIGNIENGIKKAMEAGIQLDRIKNIRIR